MAKKRKNEAEIYEARVLLFATCLFFLVRGVILYGVGEYESPLPVRLLAPVLFVAGVFLCTQFSKKGSKWLPALSLPAIIFPLMLFLKKDSAVLTAVFSSADGFALGLLWMLPFFAIFKERMRAERLGIYLTLGFILARVGEALGYAAGFLIGKGI